VVLVDFKSTKKDLAVEIYTNTQLVFSEILTIIDELYQKYAPISVKNRKNKHLQKQPDTVIISCVIWGMINSSLCYSLHNIL